MKTLPAEDLERLSNPAAPHHLIRRPPRDGAAMVALGFDPDFEPSPVQRSPAALLVALLVQADTDG
ncbi:hypothetical protein D9M70_449370 [compost metagenome]